MLFLGEWCKLYERRNVWSKYNYEVVPYHWNDRRKLSKDYKYIQEVNETVLAELSETLNDLNQSNYSLRFWRILIGPWLLLFTNILYDRWFMLKKAIEVSKNLKVITLTDNLFEGALNDFSELNSILDTDDWNQLIFSQLAEGFNIEICKKDNISSKNNIARKAKNKYKKINIITNYLQGFITKNNESFFLNDYMGLLRSFRFQIKNKQIPKLWRNVNVPNINLDVNKRNDFKNRIYKYSLSNGFDSFHSVLLEKLIYHLPRIYLEGFKELESLCSKLPWPTKPPKIFTSIGFYSDDVFKQWCASKVEKGSKLITFQHGGHYGIGKFDSTEEHQAKISNQFLTWGWSDKNKKVIKPFGVVKPLTKRSKFQNKGSILLVLNSMPRYSYRLYSLPIGTDQSESYLVDQFRFVSSLSKDLFKDLHVKLYPRDYNHSYEEKWKEKFRGINIINNKTSNKNIFKDVKYIVSTYNATTYLESLFMNIPTIVYWNSQYNEIRSSALPYFKQLEDVGIFHNDPESAATKINSTWNETKTWWLSSETQNAVERFCENYACNISSDTILN